MQIAERDIYEFADIWSEEFHEKISYEEAAASASMLLDLYWLLASEEREEDS